MNYNKIFVFRFNNRIEYSFIDLIKKNANKIVPDHQFFLCHQTASRVRCREQR